MTHRTRILFPVEIDPSLAEDVIESTDEDDGRDPPPTLADSEYGFLSFSEELDEPECCLCQRNVCVRRHIHSADGCLVMHESWEC